jgi:hypothetical protein
VAAGSALLLSSTVDQEHHLLYVCQLPHVHHDIKVLQVQ